MTDTDPRALVERNGLVSVGAMTDRQIIEARLGRKLPAPKDMRPDERKAVKRLAMELIKQRREI